MRFRFFAPVDDRETAEHLEMMRRIDVFWQRAARILRAAKGQRSVARSTRESIQKQLATELSSGVSGGIVAEVDARSGSDGSQHLELVLAPQSYAGFDPLIDAVIERAPQLPGLSVVRYRSARPLDEVVEEVRELTGIDLGSARARAGFSRGHLLEIVVYSPVFSSANDERALEAANLAVPRLIGERTFDDWVGAVDVAPMRKAGALPLVGSTEGDSPKFALGELYDAVDVAIRGVDSQLSEKPYHTYCERAEWTMLELEPEPQVDYRSLDDLALCTTMLPEMMKSALGGARFSSRRFSKHGERFAYLKVDGEGKNAETLFDQRLLLEDAFNRALVPGRVGCVVGAGLGVRYIYLVLALANVEAGLSIARRTAQKCGVPKRAWLQFLDSSWSEEWVGAYDDSPVPPGL